MINFSSSQWPFVYSKAFCSHIIMGNYNFVVIMNTTPQACRQALAISYQTLPVMHIYAQTPAACKDIGSRVAPLMDLLTIQARSQSRCVSYSIGQQKMSKYINSHSLCFLRFFYFMEHYPTALRLTSEKHRGWMYMKYLKLGVGCTFRAICTPEIENTDLVPSQ